MKDVIKHYEPVSSKLKSSNLDTMMLVKQFLHETEDNDDVGDHQYDIVNVIKIN